MVIQEMVWEPLDYEMKSPDLLLFKLTNCKRNDHLWSEILLTSKTEGSQYLGL